MRPCRRTIAAVLAFVVIGLAVCGDAHVAAQEPPRWIFPEQRRLEIRDPERIRPARLPETPVPPTVERPLAEAATWDLSLDDAIRTALANAEVVRIVAGAAAVASGATIYDPAITNTTIDEQRARFDPTLSSENRFRRIESPQGVLVNPGPPAQVRIDGPGAGSFGTTTGISQQLVTGATAAANVHVDTVRSRATGLPLNPQTGASTELSLTQPLLQGAGVRPNLVPIVVARIDTERSYFQLKDQTQELVRGVIEAYWNLVFAEADAWARRQQFDQGRETLERSEARLKAGLGDEGDVAQARVSAEKFRAAVIAADANILQREAALRNVLGIPPADERRLRPVSAPRTTRLPRAWEEIRGLAEVYRPDLIELKLIVEAGEQELLLANNTALPRVDIGGTYRWNGLEGRTPDTGPLSTAGGEFTDWELGVNFSVPLGLRQARAQLRQRELLLARDRANLQQGLHAATHDLAASYRNLAQYYAQYEAFARVREAARLNLERQLADYRAGRRTLYLNVLAAITDWGNSVSDEIQALTQYNTELANLERQTGTILETHGVRFLEERFRSIGPLGRAFPPACYPRAMRPGPNAEQPAPPANETYQLPAVIRLPEVNPGLRPPQPPAPQLPPPGAPRSTIEIVPPGQRAP